MVRIAWLRCGCGRPSACSIGAGDMVEARLIRAVVRLRIRKLRDASQPGRIRTVPAPGAGLPAHRAASRERTMPLPARAGLMQRKPDCAERPVPTPAADCDR